MWKERNNEKINEVEHRNNRENIWNHSWFFDKIKAINKQLAWLNKKKKTEITDIKHEKVVISPYFTLTEIIYQHHKQPLYNKFSSLNET